MITDYQYELFKAIEKKNFSKVVEFVDKGVNVNCYYNWPALTCAIYHDFKIATYLINIGADFELDFQEDNFYQPIMYMTHSLNMKKYANTDVINNIKRILNWIQKYTVQVNIINKNIKNIYILNKHNLVNPKIKEEYKHLFTANDLNLL